MTLVGPFDGSPNSSKSGQFDPLKEDPYVNKQTRTERNVLTFGLSRLPKQSIH